METSEHNARSISPLRTPPNHLPKDGPSWSFANLPPLDSSQQHLNRDSGIQADEAPTLPHERSISPAIRDSGYVGSPITHSGWPTAADDFSDRRHRQQSPTSSTEGRFTSRSPHEKSRSVHLHSANRQPSPVASASKSRTSELFDSSPSSRPLRYDTLAQIDTQHAQGHSTDLHRSPSVHRRSPGHEATRDLSPSSRTLHSATDVVGSGHHTGHESRSNHPNHSTARAFSPSPTRLDTIPEGRMSPSRHRRREHSNSESPGRRSQRSIHHENSGRDLRTAATIAGLAAPGALAAATLTRDSQPSAVEGLGKSRSSGAQSGDLHPTQAHDGFPDPAGGTARDMSDSYVCISRVRISSSLTDLEHGVGEHPGSPMSPTKPPSVRKRQSMQQIRDLEARVDQLANDNRSLVEAKLAAERHLQDFQTDRSLPGAADPNTFATVNSQLQEKDEDIARLRQGLNDLQQEVGRLTEVNKELTVSHDTRGY